MLRRGLALARRLCARPVEDEIIDLAERAWIRSRAAQRGIRCACWTQRLTEREREVLELIAVGRTYRATARDLMISEKTVSTDVSQLLAKTGSRSRAELPGSSTGGR